MSQHAGTGSHDDLPPRPMSAAERVMLWVSLAALALICVVVTYVVIARVLHAPLLPDDVQIVRQLLVVVIVFPLAAVAAARMHIAVTVFSEWLSPRGKRCLTILGDVLGLALSAILVAGAVRLFADSYASGEYFDGDIDIPYWMVHGAYMAALAAFCLRMLAVTITDIAALRERPASR